MGVNAQRGSGRVWRACGGDFGEGGVDEAQESRRER